MSEVTSDVSEQMRADWNSRAREDAHYYVAFGGLQQDEDAFLATAAEVVAAMEWELKRLPRTSNPRTRRALEIGCGPGRLIKPLSRHFGEIHGVDVSDEMVRIARARLRSIPHAHVHATNGASLAQFADESFDLIYSYAVFQHIPSRDVVMEYMREIVRVLKPAGVFRGQFNSLPASARPNTWSGCSFSGDDIRTFTRTHNLQLLALEGPKTQYMWTTWRKPRPQTEPATGSVAIRRITNASSSETVVPNHGIQAAISIWALNLPPSSDLNTLDVRVDTVPADVVYIGPPEPGGLQQVNAMLPAGTRTGLVPVELNASARAHVRVIPAGPLVPRIITITDGINIVQENRCTSGVLKVQLDELAHPDQISVTLDGTPIQDIELFCTDPLPPRYEINFRLPETIGPGAHEVYIHIGRRKLMPHTVIVEQANCK